jgi:hypothetical protein
MMTTDQALRNLFCQRAWYKDFGLKESTARVFKKRFFEGKLELETQMKILKTCGYKLVQEMQWDSIMNNAQIYKGLRGKIMDGAFWSYDASLIKEIPDDVLIEKVLVHLDIDDVQSLFKLYPKSKIQSVWRNRILSQEPMYHGLNRLYAFMLFEIKNPDRYIRDFKNKLYKSRLCKV